MAETRTSPHPSILIVAASMRYMGGQSVMATRLIQDLQSEGLHVDFLPVDPELPTPLRFTRKIKYLRTLVSGIFYWSSLVRLIPRYDVIHIFSASYWSFLISPAPAILIARLFGKPIILNYHSGEAQDHLRRSGQITRWLLKLPDRIIVPSQFLVNVFAEFGFRADAIPNHVDHRDAIFRRRTKLKPKIIVPRALEPAYNIPCALRVFEKVKQKRPDAIMTILGEGSLRKSLESMIAERKLKGIRLAGRVERDKIWPQYDSHDMFLNTSSIDNMPISILEAFAAGLPIVTTAAGGIPYMIQNGQNGYLVPVDDDLSAAERILHLLESPNDASRLAEGGKVSLQDYQWHQVGRQWINLYESIGKRHWHRQGKEVDEYGNQPLEAASRR
jgi:glycosyltransferase involved in cell wall biosynthesis